ncbi:GNAT family N-acetyltransferase [Sphingomonas sp.]|uniref:GNAT family N-acetyltransferase n=1 Tax=Sphingomonas sp. TaxID=28214 RepID=UPI0031DDE899
MTLSIRPFEARDKPGVIQLIVPIQQTEFGIAITAEDQPDLSDIASFYQTGAGGFWVAERSGTVVGTIGLKALGDRRAALRKMFVAAPVRGRDHGVADRLMETLVRHARGMGIADIYLGTTEAFLAAHRFYEKNGFTEIARSALPDDFPVMDVDRKFYTLRLS